jgi:hypothetical protein
MNSFQATASVVLMLFAQAPDRAVQVEKCTDKIEQAETIKRGAQSSPDIIQPAVESALGAATDIRDKIEGKKACEDALQSPKQRSVDRDEPKTDVKPRPAASHIKKRNP